MPIITLHFPAGTLSPAERQQLATTIVDVAVDVEQLPNEPGARATCWVLCHELDGSHFYCGGEPPAAGTLPIVLTLLVPAGLLNAADKQRYVQRLHLCLEATTAKQVLSSIVVQEIAEGDWALDGTLRRLPEFARMAGFRHLHNLR